VGKPGGVFKEHFEDMSCCPGDGHWWLEDVQRAALETRATIEKYGWRIQEAKWEDPNWVVSATSRFGEVVTKSDNLGACFWHMLYALKENGWIEHQYLENVSKEPEDDE
jgi:hypothetical protein